VSTFSELQTHFQKYIFENDSSIADHVIGTQKVTKEMRLSIYYNAYRLRLQEALDSSFPVLKAYLGHQPFEKLCHEYIQKYPSFYRSIRWFGDQFPAFLIQHKKYKKMKHLSELALWEWKSALAFDAKDAPVLDVAQMASIPPEAWSEITFKIHPTVQRILLSHNTVAIWQSIFDETEIPVVTSTKNPVSWVIWRKHLLIQYVSLSDDEVAAFDVIAQNQTFSMMCEKLCDYVSEDQAGLRAASLLKNWITQGLIESVVLPTSMVIV